jgi:hypothetical protein
VELFAQSDGWFVAVTLAFLVYTLFSPLNETILWTTVSHERKSTFGFKSKNFVGGSEVT